LVAPAVLALFAGLTGAARADFYAYSVQQTSNYSFTGATAGTLTPGTTTSAVQVASISGFDSHVGGLDAAQAYVGPAGGKPPENTFTPKGQVDAPYARGDALLTLPPNAATTNNVAELFLTEPGSASATGAWSISASLTLAADGTVSLSFDFTNQLTLVHTGLPPGTVQASFTYNFTIQDAAGNVVFSSAPSQINHSVSLTAQGMVDVPGSGSITITSTTLTAGTYRGTISGVETVFANAVPEPSSVALVALGVVGLGGVAVRRRLSRTV
jgi:hypothetical protein